MAETDFHSMEPTRNRLLVANGAKCGEEDCKKLLNLIIVVFRIIHLISSKLLKVFSSPPGSYWK